MSEPNIEVACPAQSLRKCGWRHTPPGTMDMGEHASPACKQITITTARCMGRRTKRAGCVLTAERRPLEGRYGDLQHRLSSRSCRAEARMPHGRERREGSPGMF